MRRHCDGTDDNLTRVIPAEGFDPAQMTESVNWGRHARPGYMVIRCQCGLRFEDENRLVIYPHDWI